MALAATMPVREAVPLEAPARRRERLPMAKRRARALAAVRSATMARRSTGPEIVPLVRWPAETVPERVAWRLQLVACGMGSLAMPPFLLAPGSKARTEAYAHAPADSPQLGLGRAARLPKRGRRPLAPARDEAARLVEVGRRQLAAATDAAEPEQRPPAPVGAK